MKKSKENPITEKWKVIEGSLEVERVFQVEDVSGRENLLRIRQMLTEEGFDPNSFFVHEYPAEGVYICFQKNQNNYFTIEYNWISKVLTPTYTTKIPDVYGNNCFSCETIKDSIRLTEF